MRLWLALGLLLLAAAGIGWLGTAGLRYQTTASGLQYRVVKEGTGPHPTSTDVTLIDYTGRLEDGTVFDTTKGKQPGMLPVAGSIPGFSEGLQLMRKGASYELRIPPQLGYGAQGNGPVPPNATLYFDVTLRDFIPMSAMRAMMRAQGMGAPAQPPQ